MGLLILFAFALAVIVASCTLGLIHHMQRPARHTFAVALAREQPTDPGAMGFVSEDHIFEFDDGTASPGWIIRGEKSDGPTVIITHGLADSRFGSLLRVPLVVPWASRVVVYDMRGHGESTAKKTTLTALEPDDLQRVMNEVDDGSPIVLMGHSMGAGVSIVVASREFEEAKDKPRVLGVIAEGGYRWPMETITNYLKHHGWPAFPAVMLAGWHFSFWLGITKHGFDRVRFAAKLSCPLLIINGEADAVSPLASAKEVAAAAPHGRMVAVSRAGHGDLPTTYKAHYSQALRDFVRDMQEHVNATRVAGRLGVNAS